MKIITLLSLFAIAVPASAETIGLWRFDDAGAAAGADVLTAVNFAAPGPLDAPASGGAPLYSDDVPAPQIFDPISGETYTNGFSLDASGGGSQILVPDDAAFNSSFTVEFFIKLVGEPGSYESVLRRKEFADLGWQVDFDHGANLAFGRSRTRWDTPAGAPDGNAEVGVDENVNFVLGPQGNANAAKVYVDTGAKDEFGADVGPQNTGNPQDYVYDAASLNPNETDVALQGDGTNDVDGWHHIAVSFDQASGEIKFYFDYLLMQEGTLSDSEGDGYTHPATGIQFGKLAATANGLLLDELRYSNTILTPGSFLREPAEGGGDTVAHWRMDDEDAVDGGEIITAANSASARHAATPANGTPTYSADVPGKTIFDPVSGTTYPNAFSLDASTANSRIGAADDMEFNTSFTVEMFIKVGGEPGGYHGFLRRRQTNDLRWQIDFDHGNMGAYGRARTRFDTPGGPPDNMNEVGVDENINIVAGPVGGASVPADQRVLVDTDPGDGLVESYDDPVDWSLDGDGLDDTQGWHHVAVTFDETTGTIGFYHNYELAQTRTLSDSEGDGYTHPAAALEFGKFAGQDYGLWLDEVRYSSKVLLPFEFLQAATEPDPILEILDFSYDEGGNETTITWRSIPGRKYGVDRSFDFQGFWFELVEDDVADGETTSFTDESLPAETARAFYRVREVE
ncbi:MAG: hypothetical protein ACR2RV_14115 [Verrucomicrobiales bacterium]